MTQTFTVEPEPVTVITFTVDPVDGVLDAFYTSYIAPLHGHQMSLYLSDGRDPLGVGIGTAKIPNATVNTWQLRSVRLDVAVPPDGGPLIVDVLNNGVSVFADPADRPAIASGESSAVVSVFGNRVFAPGDLLSVNIDAVGPVGAGGVLTVTVVVEG